MKKTLIYGICAVLLVFISCQRETDEQYNKRKGFDINIVIDDLETGLKTRAAVSPETGETKVNNLYLAFFDYHKDGAGSFVGYYQVPGPNFEMGSTITVPSTITDGTISPSQSYVILAFANLDETSVGANDGYIDNIADFLEDLKLYTENRVLHKVCATVSGAGQDEGDNSHAISSSNIFMSARVVRMGSDEATTTINLKRGVSRFDVINDAVSTHELKSVSIWGAADETTVWEDAPIEYNRLQRFYGVKDITGNITRGKLYAFENVVVDPLPNDAETTCLIVGLAKTSEPNKIRYYRVNIHLLDAAQNLKRNHSYQITVNSVNGEGSGSEYEAWKQNNNELLVTVNNWNLDDNGMILTDGTNTLGLPVKRIRFNPQGDIREYSLYTVGNGVLEITKSAMPMDDDGVNVTPGFTAVIDGNVLRVTATKLPAGEQIRRGSIEVSFAGLRGNIDMIQEPLNEKTLSLDRNTIANFAPVGRYGITDGPLTVTASGPWVAQIFNTDDTPGNPGFSFEPNGEAVTRLESGTNPFGDRFQIYTTGDNPDPNNVRSGFVIVSLVEDPDNFSVAVPLTQDVPQKFEVLPILSELRFNADASPFNAAIATGDMYEFTVNTGGEDWTVTLDGGNSDKFEVVKMTERRFTVKTTGKNSTESPYTSTIKVARTSDVDPIDINVIQDPAVINVYFTGQIPNTGGALTVNVLSSNLPWKAEIIENWNSGSANYPHLAWLEESANTTHVTVLPDQTGNGTFKVDFPALKAPLVNMTPKVKVKVSLIDLPEVSQTIEVVQLPLAQELLRVLDVRHYSYGSLGGYDSWFGAYNSFLRNGSLFGPAGRVKVPTIRITEIANASNPGAISSDYGYVHAGGNPNGYNDNRFQRIETWRINNDGVVVFVCDNNGKQLTNSNSTLNQLGYRSAGYNSRARINAGLLTSPNVTHKNIMNYLLNDGPFGKVNNPGSQGFTIDGVSAAVSIGYIRNGTPVITNGNGNALLVIDPENKLVYIGESQFFNTGYNTGINSDKDRFLGNLLSYILNAATNGSAFTDVFSNDALYKERFGK